MSTKLTKEEKQLLKAERRKQKKEKGKGLIAEFQAFVLRGNVIDMAVGVIVATAFTAIVKALTNGILLPWIGWLIGNQDFSSIKQVLTPAVLDAENNILQPEVAILWGSLIQAVIDFILIALVIFITIKIINSIRNRIEAVKNLLAKKEEAQEVAEPVVVEPTLEEKTYELLKEIRDSIKK